MVSARFGLLIGCGVLAALARPEVGFSQDPDSELSLDALLKLEVSVASKKKTTIREQPGIVTVITHDQMVAAGNRDLLDTLNVLVPGFTFGSDMEIGASTVMRGIWGCEGKVLLMVDGQTLNEEKFGTTQWFHHFPIDNVNRVEIIRGPGSAVYGGYAALAVINIITKGSEMNGGYGGASANYTLKRDMLEQRASAGYGGKSGDIEYAVNAFVQRGPISDKTATMYMGNDVDLRKGLIKAGNLNSYLAYNNTSLRVVLDRYEAPAVYFDDTENFPWEKIKESYDSYHVELKHDWHASDALTVSPFVRYKYEKPFYTDYRGKMVHDANDDGSDASWLPTYIYRNTTDKKEGGLALSWDMDKQTNVQAGYQAYVNTIYRPKNPNDYDEQFNPEMTTNADGSKSAVADSGSDHMSYRNDALYLQVMNSNDIVNTTVGARYDKTDAFGSNFAPRIGFTKVLGDFHMKYMVAQSFRVPGGILMNETRVKPGQDRVTPERAVTNEIEMGHRLSDNLWVVGNVFDVLIRDAIYYGTDGGTSGRYGNGGKIRSRGFESDVKYVSDQWTADLNYAYYRLVQADDTAFRMDDHKGMLYAAPQHRAGFMLSRSLTPSVALHTSGTLLGNRYAHASQNSETQKPELAKYPAVAVVNCGSRLSNFMSKGLSLDVNLHNLTNAKYEVGQPYNAVYPMAPLPGPSRSLALAVTQTF